MPPVDWDAKPWGNRVHISREPADRHDETATDAEAGS